MSRLFKEKIIVVFSPQSWNHLFVSKHHYAKVLSKDNQVYFISSPVHQLHQFYNVEKIENGLSIIHYSVMLPELIKFKFPSLYKKVLQVRLTSILKRECGPVDYCIDFGCYQFFDSLKFFTAKYKIFFPVDDFAGLKGDPRGSNIVFTVSKEIQKKFANDKCHFINHGLADDFVKITEQELSDSVPWHSSERVKVGYSGNIFLRFIDFEAFEQVIQDNPLVEFHFFGSKDIIQKDENYNKWDLFLKNTPNVVLHGWVDTKRLVELYKKMDFFIICYKPDGKNYHGENSHKILEYLSTGKVIASSHVSLYRGMGMFEMNDLDNRYFPALFAKVLDNLAAYNSLEKMQARRKFALDNSYQKQLCKIEDYINGNDGINK